MSDLNPNGNPSEAPAAQPEPAARPARKPVAVKLFAIGNAGLAVAEQLIAGGLPKAAFVAVDTDPQALAGSSAAEKLQLETQRLRGLGTGGDPERGRALAEEHETRLKGLCEGMDFVFVTAGLGGGAGSGIGPVVARVAKETGALVLGFVKMPFECEGSRRQALAQQGSYELLEAADGVICLPNQKVFGLIDDNTSVLDAFKLTNDLLADAVRGIWNLLTRPGLIEIHPDELCALLRERHSESAFAVADAVGPTRSRDVLDKLFAHPMLEQGSVLAESDSVLVSLLGGPDLTMSEVNRVMSEISSRCPGAQVLMGAAIDDAFREHLALTLIAARKGIADAPASRFATEELSSQLLRRAGGERPGSRLLPPAPTLPPDKMQQMLARQRSGRSRKALPRMRQAQLPLEIISKGRFDKSEPTIHKGEDLDVPTYIRRGVALN